MVDRTFRVEVSSLDGDDAAGKRFVSAARQLGVTAFESCRLSRLYFLKGEITRSDVERLSRELLADPVMETFKIVSLDTMDIQLSCDDHFIEVTLLPGVTDSAADNLLRAAHLKGIETLQQAATGQCYRMTGSLDDSALMRLAAEVFANPVIQRFKVDGTITPPFIPVQQVDDTVDLIAIREADDDELLHLSVERRLALDLAEMQAIRDYFRREGRDCTDAEIEMLAQTWSEHCVHKTFKAEITYTGPLPGEAPDSLRVEQSIDGLLKTYIRAATESVNKSWVRSAFVDNAGIVAFDDQYDLAFKVETHNHPSALEPFGGANTGVGGVIRDILGVSARPIANTDILCFGLPDLSEALLPTGVLHPRRIADGVVHGIEDYGNKMGIPTVNGAILYHKGYASNPLVFCGCLGLLPHGTHPNDVQSDDLIVVIGGRTGRDGLRGATFSSMEMDTTTSEVAGSSVQIGNPIQEKQVQEVIWRARDEKQYHAITDCGAGGLSSAVGEMGQKLGARVHLETVPLKYPGLRPWEVWLSEAQERMVLAVPPDKWERLRQICVGQDVEAVSIGKFEPTGRLRLFHNERVVADIAMEFLHDGIPQRHLRAVWSPPKRGSSKVETKEPSPVDLKESLLKLLAHPNIRSKESVIRRYDHEVQAGTVVKPLVGVANHGPSDAAVIIPLDAAESGNTRRGVAIANGICPLYGEIDPYAMAWAAVDEAIRNLVAVGADPDQIAILDNFCWGNANLPDRLGSLVRCAQGCYDAAVAYCVPFISGKDSLNNEYADVDGQRHAIPGTLLISSIGIVPDIGKTVTMDLKAAGNLLYVIGESRDEMGGSHYNLVNGVEGGTVPQPVPNAIETMRALHKAIQAGLVQSCHDVSEGGIAVALAEMCIAGRLGGQVILSAVPGARAFEETTEMLFSESLSRFIVEIESHAATAFEDILSDLPCQLIGKVVKGPMFWRWVLFGRDDTIMYVPTSELETAWRGDMPEPTLQPAPPVDQRRDTVLIPTVSERKGKARVLILHANGSNRDRDAAAACELAGGEPEIVHVNQLKSGECKLLDYHMLVVPGGFSYGDDLGAGTLWALDLHSRLGDDMRKFIEESRPVLGICNGFQALVKSGLLPGGDWRDGTRRVTLTNNESGHFECRWVYLKPNKHSPCLFIEGLDDLIYCPVAHGEGRIAVSDEYTTKELWSDGLAALTYVDVDGETLGYPISPNGSVYNIAGLCNPAGNVFGLMPHPEDHVFNWQHPRWQRGEAGMTGLKLFQNGIKFA